VTTVHTGLIDTLTTDRILPVATLADSGSGPRLAHAVAAGGLHCLELTLRTPTALDAIRVTAAGSDLFVGAGTVLTAAQVDQAVRAGASFNLH
jgi:2-dehydro-3-deoxyphosphogluconate aldolase/(4S)-4-hydroxy-2-oxoglutarate aldolase